MEGDAKHQRWLEAHFAMSDSEDALAQRILKEAARGSSFVEITREDMEDWMSSTGLRWERKSGSAGVYVLILSNLVGISVSSSVGSRDTAMGYAKGSMQMRLISRVTGRVLNKKAQGRSHFKRTTNWRATMQKAVDDFKSTYLKAQSFYDALAEIEDQKEYAADLISKIESFSGWESNNILKDFHEKLVSGKILTIKQRSLLERLTKGGGGSSRPSAPSAPDEPNNEELLQRMRALWVAAKRDNNTWLMDFTRSLADQLKNRGRLSDRQTQVLEKNLSRYRI